MLSSPTHRGATIGRSNVITADEPVASTVGSKAGRRAAAMDCFHSEAVLDQKKVPVL